MGAHSRYSPSASKQWMACPGSLNLSEGIASETSEAASEGTAAHALGEICLLTKTDPQSYIGKEILVDDKGVMATVTEDMADAVTVYVDQVNSLVKPGDKFIVEASFDLSIIHKGLFGTSDFGYVDGSTIYVTDYKHGKGIVVEIEGNTQLMIYALGVLSTLTPVEGNKIRRVVLTIVQPRAYHVDGPVRSWEIPIEKLLSWSRIALKPALLETDKENAFLCAGEHCRFCNALPVCPEQVKNAIEVAKTTFADPILPPPEDLTPEDISKVLILSDAFGSWASKVKIFAQTRAEIGIEIPNHKLVAKQSNRAWKSEEEAEGKLLDLLDFEDDVYKKKVITPAQAEKALTALGFKPKARKEMLDHLWEKPDKGITLVKDSDKREAIAPPSAEAFLDGADFLQ